MVKLEEVPDEDLNQRQSGVILPEDDDDEYETDNESDAGSIVSSIGDETLYERIVALQDIIPPRHQYWLSTSCKSVYKWTSRGLAFSGKAAWVLGTSSMLVAIPWIIGYGDEVAYMEEEMKAQLQQSAGDILAPSGSSDTAIAGL